MHADLDTLVIALYVSIDELFGPRLGAGCNPSSATPSLSAWRWRRSCWATAASGAGCGLPTTGLPICSLPAHPSAYNWRLRRAVALELVLTAPGASCTEAGVANRSRPGDSTHSAPTSRAAPAAWVASRAPAATGIKPSQTMPRLTVEQLSAPLGYGRWTVPAARPKHHARSECGLYTNTAYPYARGRDGSVA